MLSFASCVCHRRKRKTGCILKPFHDYWLVEVVSVIVIVVVVAVVSVGPSAVNPFTATMSLENDP